MNRGCQRILLVVLALVLALLPFVEIFDHWESIGSDPEFVSVCTVVGIAFGAIFVLRRAILSCLRRLWPNRFSLGQSLSLIPISATVIQAVFPRIRAPIRV